jgi:hypothetical protein
VGELSEEKAEYAAGGLNGKAQRYYELKQRQREIEKELNELRGEITKYCAGQGLKVWDAGSHLVKIVLQDRKEYDDNKLFNALPDPSIWKMLSKADPTKIASLIKLNVLNEERLRQTYTTKTITLLQVEKK